MIVKPYRNAVVIYQSPDDEVSVSEHAIVLSEYAGGLIILQQGDATILVNRASVEELRKALLAALEETK